MSQEMNKQIVEDLYELSPMQQGMLFETLYAPESGVYVIQICFKLDRSLNVTAFQQAWQGMIDHHPILRTLFLWQRSQSPLQVVRKQVTLPWRHLDWRDNDRAEETLQAWLQADRQAGFALDQPPLMRCTLIQQKDEKWLFVWTHHHLIGDGWSMPLLLQELLTRYDAACAGQILALPSPRPYRDYILWLRRQARQHAESFWREQLQGFTAPTPFQVDQRADSRTTTAACYATQQMGLSVALSATLTAWVHTHQLTLNTLMQGAWALLLSRYSGNPAVLFGATVAGRPSTLRGVEEMVGLFINTLPVAVSLPSEQPVLVWLHRLQQTQAVAQEYAYIPLSDIQSWSDIPQDMPLFESILVFENYPINPTLARASTLIQEIHAYEQTHLPLTLAVVPGAALTWRISYDTRRFEPAAIERMLGHLHTLVAGIVANPAQHLDELPLLAAAERHQLLVEWNDTATDYPKEKTIHQLFEEQAARTPAALAVAMAEEQRRANDDGSGPDHQSALCNPLSLTYRELNERANQLAHHLIGLGVQPDTLVAVAMERSIEMVVTLLAVLKAGGVYVPIDPTYPTERIRFLLADSAAPILLTQSHLALTHDTGSVVAVDKIEKQLATRSTQNPQAQIASDHLAYVIYTSGSTGQPKGVMIEHESLTAHIQTTRETYGVTERDRILQFASLSFDVSLEQIFLALCTGATLIVRGNRLWSSAEFDQQLLNHAITVANVPPAYFHQLLLYWQTERPALLTGQLRLMLVGGEKMMPETVKLWQRLSIPHVQLLNVYGPTETTITATCFDLSTYPVDARVANLPIGKPLGNRRLYLLDSYHQPTPIGVAGELYIGGVQLARSYLNRPELTAERFIEHPEFGRLYKTGDMCRWMSDGNIEYMGRTDFQVKIRGFRIELGEIESVLLAQPGVSEGVVVVREEQPGDKRLIAYVVQEGKEAAGLCETSAPATVSRFGKLEADVGASERLRQALQRHLPDYMIPSAFVFLTALPLTSNGKLDRRALPPPDDGEAQAVFVAPGTPQEAQVAAIWAGVLGIERTSPEQRRRISRHDNFFALGGHSLLATQVVSRIRQTLGVDLPLRTLFNHPTVAGLASEVERLQASQQAMLRPPLVPVVRGDRPVASYAQQRMWFLAQMAGSDVAYQIPLLLELVGALDVGALAGSWQAVVERHEVLRTSYTLVEGEVRQIIHPPLRVTLPVEVRAEASEAAIEAWVNEALGTRFDLANGLPWRIRLLQVAEDRHLLLLTLHHIAADGWSLGLVAEELSQHYRAWQASGGERGAELPPLAVQYADYAAWQRHWLQGEVLQQQVNYWREQLAGAPTLLALPTDFPRPAVQSYRGASVPFTLEAPLLDRMQAVSEQAGVTLFMTLLAAFQVLLYRYSGQNEIVVGTPIANRTQVESEPLIGMLVNTLALRSRLTGEMSFGELLREVRRITQAAYEHQDLPFEQVVEQVQPQRSLSHAPLCQVMFAWQNNRLPDLVLPGVAVRWRQPPQVTSKLDLTLSLMEQAGRLVGGWEYNSDLFASSTIERMIGHFRTLLAGIVANPSQRLDQLPLLTAAERRQLLIEWNDTATDYPSDKTIHQLFEEQVTRTPDAVAVVMDDGARGPVQGSSSAPVLSTLHPTPMNLNPETVTYRELNERANQLTHYLRTMGVGPEVLVGICVERSLEMVVGLLGILKAGGAYLPLDPTYPTERLAFMLQDSHVSVVLTQAHLQARLPSTDVQIVCLDEKSAVFATQAIDNPISHAQAETLAYVMYTSGSTGQPKGTNIIHRNVVRLVKETNFMQTGSDEVFLQLASISFDATTLELWAPLLNGGKLVLMPPYQPSLTEVGIAIQRYQVTSLWLTAGLFHLMVDEQLDALRPLRQLVAGGDVLSPRHVQRVRQALPDCRLINGYGPTENTTFTCCYPVSTTWTGRNSVPIGRPIANTQVYILDNQRQPVPIGVVGELYAGGDGVANGYYQRPELTAEKFIPNPYGAGCLYKTGDLCRWLADGNIEYLGRIDQQVKIRGFRIELGEIESVLSQHPAVQEAVVMAYEESPSEKWLVAYVVQNAGSKSHAADRLPAVLRAYLQSKLPEYMLPSLFIEMAAFPLTPNGKVDRKALPAPTQLNRTSGPYLAPRNFSERQLVQIWERVLGRCPISIHDHFFEVGGHSLLAVQLMARIQQVFGCALPLNLLFQYPTVAELAAYLETPNLHDLWAPLVTIQPQGDQPAFFCLPGAGGNPLYLYPLANGLGSTQPFYSLQAVGLDGITAPHATVDAAATHYLAEIQRVQPSGPYYLGGHSYGGLVAFEMAQQLLRQGESVALLVILDTGAPGLSTERINNECETMLGLVDTIAAFSGQAHRLTAEKLELLAYEERLQALLDFFVTVQFVPPGTPLTIMRGIWQVFNANVQTHYQPTAVQPLPITLFTASANTEEDCAKMIEGWKPYGLVTVKAVPGSHITMMTEPHVRVLAQELAEVLAQSRRLFYEAAK